jgi:hypothetical protein
MGSTGWTADVAEFTQQEIAEHSLTVSNSEIPSKRFSDELGTSERFEPEVVAEEKTSLIGEQFASFHCKFIKWQYNDCTFGIFPRPRQQWRGIVLSLQLLIGTTS